MKDARSIIICPLRTEKGTNILPLNKYLFLVERNANKVEIRHAVEEIYKVKVERVNTVVVPGKKKRIRYVEGETSEWKKAVVTLKQGNKIDMT